MDIQKFLEGIDFNEYIDDQPEIVDTIQDEFELSGEFLPSSSSMYFNNENIGKQYMKFAVSSIQSANNLLQTIEDDLNSAKDMIRMKKSHSTKLESLVMLLRHQNEKLRVSIQNLRFYFIMI